MADRSAAPSTDARSSRPNTLLNALVGAVVTVVTAPLLPVAAVFGGAVAGYLQRGDLAAGVTVGALSGLFAAVPAFLLTWLVVGVVFLGVDTLFAFTSLFAFVVFFAVAAYLVVAGALGGAVGAYLRREL
ncbi:MAG: DUF5518 domain-containing protein [Halobacteriaceae archaeon]